MTEAVAIPAMALGLSSAFCALSVAATAVALAVPVLLVSLLELSRVVLVELVVEEGFLVVIVADLSIDEEADNTTSLDVAADTTGPLEDSTAVDVCSVVAGGVDTLVSVGRGTRGTLVIELGGISDRLRVKAVLSAVEAEALELDSSVVMSLTVAVIVSAMLGIAP